MSAERIVAPTAAALERAVALLRAGALVALPTETVYGLGADATNAQAVAGIFAAKGRPADHPLIVHLPSAVALDRWARDVPAVAHRLAAAFWPGPLTLVLKRATRVLDAVTGGQDTVGLRVPDHPVALALLAAFGGEDGGGLAAPSANRFGRISPTSAQAVAEELGERVALILNGGPCRIGIESTILDLSSKRPRLLRPGAIAAATLAEVLGERPQTGGHDAPRVSGKLAAHYAPRTPLILAPRSALAERCAQARAAGLRLALYAAAPCPLADERHVHFAPAPTEAANYARTLYANLRRLDAADFDLIIVETPPAEAAWQAIGDRLRRAAAGSPARTGDTAGNDGQQGLPTRTHAP